MGCNGGQGSYAIKVIQYPVSAKLDRMRDGIPFNHLPHGSDHPGGANFVLGDGSVHFINDMIDTETYRALATSNGEELNAQIPD